MNNPNPKDVILWTLRRNELDVVNLYNYLSGIMQVSTGGNFLNFGYWDGTVNTPFEAQENLCKIVGDMLDISSAKNILDVGSGLSEPAIYWTEKYSRPKIICININSNQLHTARNKIYQKNISKIDLVNSTATNIPVLSESFQRIIALESAQHFRPINKFISEAKRILEKDGKMLLAIPVVLSKSRSETIKLGILRFTWSSEHYDIDVIKKAIEDSGLSITDLQMIGTKVYTPLAEYYIHNRQFLKTEILKRYPSYVETILFRSMLKMKEMSEKKIIEYALVKCTK